MCRTAFNRVRDGQSIGHPSSPAGCLYGGSGNDQIEFGVIDPGGLNTGFDYVDGGNGWDIITLSGTPTYLWTACGLTHLSGVEEIMNTSGTQPGYILVNGSVDFLGVQREE